jgi:uncharacterized membrane protein
VRFKKKSKTASTQTPDDSEFTSPLQQLLWRVETRHVIRFITISGIVGLIALPAAYLVYWRVFGRLGWSDQQQDWGLFGDFVGGVLNPIFAFLSLLALLLTVILQNKEIHQSHEELRKSNDTLQRQNFENTFFQMLRRFGDLISQAKIQPFGFMFNAVNKPNAIEGRSAFRGFYNQLEQIYKREIDSDEPHSTQRTVHAYEEFYGEWHHELGHYFRTLYHIFTFIDRSSLPDAEKVIYANIIRAQLSSYELCLLFYNGIWGEGKVGFKPLIEKYGILKHIDWRLLLHREDNFNKELYFPTAFMGREEREQYHDKQIVNAPPI